MSRIAGLALVAVLMVLVAAFPARAQVPDPPKTPVAEGTGGSAATVDPLATQAAIDTLRSGGNAVDAAVAAAGVLGVVEPFSCGIGGGGFMVVYDARHHKVDTIDSREAAPAGMHADDFGDPPTKPAMDFTEARVGGLSVGVPGTVRGWQTALNRYGTRSLKSLLRARRADRQPGLHDRPDLQPAGQGQRADLQRLPGHDGAVPDARRDGQAGRLRADATPTWRRPTSGSPATPTASTAAGSRARSPRPSSTRRCAPAPRRPVHPGTMTPRDLAALRAKQRKPTRISYRGLDVFGMGPPSSGGSTIGEALNILEGFPRNEPRDRQAAPLPRGVEARLRGPQRVRRGPGLRGRPAARAAVRPVRRVAALADHRHRAARPAAARRPVEVQRRRPQRQAATARAATSTASRPRT